MSTAYCVIQGKLNSLMWNHGHRGAEDGKELHKREADDKSCVDFQLPLPCDVPGLQQLWSFQGAPPGREGTKANSRTDAWRTGGRGGAGAVVRVEERRRREVGGEAVENFSRIADFLGCCEMKTKESVKLCGREVISDLC